MTTPRTPDSLKPGEARCPAPSMQDIIRGDAVPPPPPLASESYRFLGDADIPYERYTSPAFMQLEFDRLWNRTWQWACREEHIPEAGDYIVYDIGPYSIIVTRMEDGSIRGYHNACLHRGTKLRASHSEGSTREFRCTYHGWTWNLDGSLKAIPCAWDFPHVSAATHSLPQVKVDCWGGFVFINMDDDAQPLLDYLEVLPAHFRNWRIEDRYVALHVQKELPCNWKAAQEAFMEAYHTLETHPQLLYSTGDANTQYDVFGDHINRFYAALGVASPHITEPISEQEMLDRMLMGDRSAVGADTPKVPAGSTARAVMASHLRGVLGKAFDTDLSGYSDSEIIDTIEYHVFPNMFLFPGISLPMVYRFRPLGMDPNRALFDMLFMRPVPAHGPRPEPAQPFRITVEQSYTTVPGMDPVIGHVYDQDTMNLQMQQEGFRASKKRGQTLGNYQEVRIRALHQTLDKYLYGTE